MSFSGEEIESPSLPGPLPQTMELFRGEGIKLLAVSSCSSEGIRAFAFYTLALLGERVGERGALAFDR